MAPERDLRENEDRGPPRAAQGPGPLLSALQGSFSSTYLTLTSIIQGVTLGYLVVVVDDEKGRFELAHWLLVATTFLIIVAAWHEYMMAVTVLTWIAGLRDSLIPFLLGGSELMLVLSLRYPGELEWSFLAAGIASFVALIAFANMYRSAAAEPAANKAFLAKTRRYRWVNLGFMCFAGVMLVAFSAVEARAGQSDALDVVLAAITLCLVLLFLARGALYWHHVIELARTSCRPSPDRSHRRGF